MELDRRAVVTGLGAVAVAGIVPSLPVEGLPLPLLRYISDGRLVYAGWELKTRRGDVVRFLQDSTWHFQLGVGGKGLWHIRHLATFRQFDPDPLFPNSAVLEFAYVETRNPDTLADLDIHTIGFAAYETVAALYAFEGDHNPPLGSATGAALISYPYWELPDPLEIPHPLWFEDVPPLEICA